MSSRILYSARRIASYLGVSIYSVYSMELPILRAGNRYITTTNLLDQYLEEQLTKQAQQEQYTSRDEQLYRAAQQRMRSRRLEQRRKNVSFY